MPAKRQKQIIQYLTQHKRSEIAELSELLKGSLLTTRRKLRVMEKNGLLLRFHGSAQLLLPLNTSIFTNTESLNKLKLKRKSRWLRNAGSNLARPLVCKV